MNRFLYPILGLVLLIATVAQVSANRAKVTTPPGAAVPHGENNSVVAEGRLVSYPDAQVTVGSDAAGTIDRLAVHEKDVVHRGDVIAVIPSDVKAGDAECEPANALANNKREH